MDKRIIIVLVLVIVIVAGVGGAMLLLNRTPATPVATPFPSATPAVSAQTQPTLTTQISSPLTASGSATIDVYLDTKATKIDGFQFIATLNGTALPTISDADSGTEGTQISPENIPELTTSTNNVTEQDGAFVIRFAMVSSDSTLGYSNTSPTKVASIPVLAGSGGNVTLTFNQQNSRARLLSGGEDTLVTTTDGTFPVASSGSSSTQTSVSTASSSLLAQTAVTTTPAPTTAATATTSPFCLASCFSDGDCAAGLACETDRCVNPACPTSQTCGCGANQTAQTVTTTPVPTVVASAAATPIVATSAPIAEASSSAQDLPTSGSVEYTLLAIGAGLFLIGGGVLLTAKQEA
ncbi:MAG: hypothetical protein ABI758_02050 [Candidatus Woesebacteria bacterium]